MYNQLGCVGKHPVAKQVDRWRHVFLTHGNMWRNFILMKEL
jgi:hypothetical protein